MQQQSGFSGAGTAASIGRVHVLGAGPVGLLLTALLQPLDGLSVRLYEKRREYTRTRMVRLASYLVADSVDGYRAGHFDGDNVEAVFDPAELAQGLEFRQSIPPDLMALLREWAQGFCPLERDRALAQRSDRYSRLGLGGADRGCGRCGGGDRVARAGGRADRLHGQ